MSSDSNSRTIENWFSAVKENDRCTRENMQSTPSKAMGVIQTLVRVRDVTSINYSSEMQSLHDVVVYPNFWPRFHFPDFSRLSWAWKYGPISSFFFFCYTFSRLWFRVTYRFADPPISGAIRNRLWNTRNTCGIFIREYRFCCLHVGTKIVGNCPGLLLRPTSAIKCR